MSDLYSGAGLKLGLIGTGVLGLSYGIARIFAVECKNPELQPNFSVPDYTGTWYEFEKSPNPFQKG